MDTSTGMIAVPPGRVTLSDRRTQRSWSVEVAPYLLASCPVTRERYEGLAGDRRPAHSVSWLDAVHHCNSLSRGEGLKPAYAVDGEEVAWDRDADGYRLPTEAEWEHACRAGTDGPRYGELDEIAWHRGNSRERPHEVGELLPNAFGLYDLLGNVWEWCWDLYDPEVYGSYRVLRGGGWFDEHWSCRASVRRRSHPTLRIDDVGFRVARSISG
ncbi:SUMF1/EgtB/PvdO family nonheme iron enzyme [Streptomyces sp. FH025]|uniref:formylglycine-generating enzyme family protein n=1 Tax=Streptomyces sp. FH025 TaxID=2815937 RepID=UPI001A9D0204|nr:SUMF1/EgtB/PvdO family nonheme iron enzyme [Streptomyces sp. FH025]MBO1415260.1 SUMF1/EgtB/PvdO family nonheme iron enzyme [Streptomyces sp. FH025]